MRKQTNEEPETEEAHRQINEEEILSAAVEFVPRDKLAQCCLCPASSSPVCAWWVMLMFQDWFVCIQQWGTPHKQWNRHAALTRCPLVSDCPVPLWEPVVTWPGESLRKRRGTLGLPSPSWSPRNPCSPGPTVLSHTHAKPLCTNAFLLCQHTHTHTDTSTQQPCSKHTYSHSCVHLYVYTLVHRPSITLKCTHGHPHAQQARPTIKHNLGLADA